MLTQMKDQYSRHLPHIEPGIRPVFITFCTRARWKLPGSSRDIVLRHVLHDNGIRFHLHGAVVMPDHVHMVITPLPGADEIPFTLATIMSGIKGASAHSINKSLGRRAPFGRMNRLTEFFVRRKAYGKKSNIFAKTRSGPVSSSKKIITDGSGANGWKALERAAVSKDSRGRLSSSCGTQTIRIHLDNSIKIRQLHFHDFGIVKSGQLTRK